MGPGHYWFGGEIIFFILTILIILVIVLAILRCAFWRRHIWPHWIDACHRHHIEHKDTESATDIVKKRYAKGEITKEQFEQVKKDLAD
jgi:putative membrane protein